MNTKKLDLRNYIPLGKQYVVADIHGYCQTFLAALGQIGLTKDDDIFFLGDYINRGPDSKGVIDTIINLKNLGYRVYPLKGNHEDMAMKGRIDPSYRMSNVEGNLIEPYKSFFENLIHFVEMDEHYLSHAGFNFTVENPFEDYKGMYWTMKLRLGHTSTTNKQIVRGHVSHLLAEIQEAIDRKHQIIPLDNGIYKTEVGKGNLCILELTDWKLIIQENKDE